MSETWQSVLDRALKLSVDDRAVVAASLWASFRDEFDPEIEAAWAKEVRRRLRRIESGEDQTVPWEEVRDRLRAKYAR